MIQIENDGHIDNMEVENDLKMKISIHYYSKD